jgi:ribonuclease J
MRGLRFIALSGTTDVTENLYIYEYRNDMIVIDCGVGFPEAEMYGVDLVIPDFSYIKENAAKLRGILVSHGHEDHYGALPFLLREVKAPVYATKLTAGFIESKLSDYKVRNYRLNVFDPDKDAISLGAFKAVSFRVSHSVPDGVGFAIDTPEGRVFHVADYKFDWTPVDKRPFDTDKAAVLAAEGALMLASDCLGSTTPGYTESEREIEKKIEEIARQSRGQIFFTTISSNISRMQQTLNVAKRLGRKVAFIGRSVDEKGEIARKLGYLHYPKDLVISPKKAAELSREKVMYIISGSYGQPGSALYRLALGEHDFLSIGKDDTVIFSSDPAPPGSKANVDAVVDSLIDLNVDVHYYEMQEDLHVSGHGSQEDIKMLFALIKPKYFVPIGGTVRHMHAYSKIVQDTGAKTGSVFELRPGEYVEFKGNQARVAGKLATKSVLVDGLGIGDVGNIVLRDRHRLAQDGIVIVLLQVDEKGQKLLAAPEIISRGFVFEKKQKHFLAKAAKQLTRQIEGKRRIDKRIVRNVTIDFLERFFFDETGRRPMVLPVIVEV